MSDARSVLLKKFFSLSYMFVADRASNSFQSRIFKLMACLDLKKQKNINKTFVKNISKLTQNIG